MREKIKIFLESGLLEEYLMGLTSDEDTQKVKQYISQYPEVKSEYEKMQDDIEAFAKKYRASMPEDLKEKILKNVDDSQNTNNKILNQWTIILMGLSIAFLASTIFLFSQNRDLKNSKSQLESEYAALKSDCNEQLIAFTELKKEHAILSHHLTQKLKLQGNGLGEGLGAVAYWNKKAEASFMKFHNLPKAPEAHCYQLWADVDGKMVNMGVIPESKTELLKLPYKNNATSLNITIEPNGGSEHPTVSRLIASTPI